MIPNGTTLRRLTTARPRLAVLAPAVLLLAAVLAATVMAQPAGDEFQVNSYTTGDQFDPRVAALPAGELVVVWTSEGSPGDDSSLRSVQGQRFDGGDFPLDPQFQVNSYTTGYQQQPAVAADAGGFVVVWTSAGSSGSDSSHFSVQGQRFLDNGIPQDAEFQINTYTTNIQELPDVDLFPDGSFVVVWQSYGSNGNDDSGRSIQGQRFDVDGALLGSEFQVNTHTTDEQQLPAVAKDPGGGFVVTWFSTDGDGSGRSVRARRFDSSGDPLGDDFQVNTYTTAHQYASKVAVDDGGDFVVVWSSGGSSGDDSDAYSVQGQRYDDLGPLGGEFQVNAYTTSNQTRPAVATGAGGQYVVVWSSGDLVTGPDGDAQTVAGRLFGIDGYPMGGEFIVNAYTTGPQSAPSVAFTDDGDFVIAWRSEGSAGDDLDAGSIQARRLLEPLAIFRDGFESGDTSAWSATVP